jgi:hypothetical protein
VDVEEKSASVFSMRAPADKAGCQLISLGAAGQALSSVAKPVHGDDARVWRCLPLEP